MPRRRTSRDAAFVEDVRLLLGRSLLPRLRAGVAKLSEADVWWRPNEASNSVGNLLLHLAGNVRQWIVHGVGGTRDVRARAAEFAAPGSMPMRKRGLLATVSRAIDDADRVLARLDPARLADPLVIQGYRVTVQGALLHVAEHFSYHTGQVLYVVKMRSGRNLGFYAHLDSSKGSPARSDSVSRRKPSRSNRATAAARSGPP